jgi:hypothetical protein
MTLYHSGLAIDTSSLHSNLSKSWQENLQLKYRSYLGMLNWLSISTPSDLTIVHSLLASAMESPFLAHLDAFADANWRPQDASTPSDSNTQQVCMDETHSYPMVLLFGKATKKNETVAARA